MHYKLWSRIAKELEERLERAPTGHLASMRGKFYAKLIASENLLIEAFENSRRAANVKVTSASHPNTTGGSLEFGPILHWLNHPPLLMEPAVEVIVKVLNLIEGKPLPASQITGAEFDEILKIAATAGLVTEDGSLAGTSKYELLDTGWLFCMVYFFYYRVFPEKIFPFNNTPAKPVQLTAADGKHCKIAILGDWGTGEYGHAGGPALAVMAAIETLDPDYIVHLGDVYYAGTEGFVRALGEEDNHLMDKWPARRSGGNDRAKTSFTLNSNHEMYDGANGYFGVALKQRRTPFWAQRKASFFAAEFGDWAIVGLDSAYYSSPHDLFLGGDLGGMASVQVNWVKRHYGERRGKKIIAMTHHNGVNYDGRERVEDYWAQMKAAFGDVPDYWYWGHIHNGIVYGDDLPLAQGAKLRCVGHGAIPYGNAWGLKDVPHIDYYPQTRISSPSDVSNRVRNGFAMITLGKHGAISEAFYEVEDGTKVPIKVWSRPAAAGV